MFWAQSTTKDYIRAERKKARKKNELQKEVWEMKRKLDFNTTVLDFRNSDDSLSCENVEYWLVVQLPERAPARQVHSVHFPWRHQIISRRRDPWLWIYNCLRQWSERAFRFNLVTLPLNRFGEKAWKVHHWTHSSKANHGSAQASPQTHLHVIGMLGFMFLT